MTDQPFGDIPFFRELQKLLSSSSGPVNLEIARQVAAAVASQSHDGYPGPDDQQRYAEHVRSAELVLAGYTRLIVEEPAGARVVNRREWVDLALPGWSWVLDSVATTFNRTLTDQAPEEAATGLGSMMEQVMPLMMGLQAGSLIGHLSNDALASYDLPLPPFDDRLILVLPNAAAIASDYQFEVAEFERWIALRETAHHLVTRSATWTTTYHRSLIGELIESIDIDLGDIENRLVELQSGGLEGLTGSPDTELLPVVPTERHSAALARLRAFVSVFHGYARHASSAVADELIPGAAKIDEGMVRQAAVPSEGKRALGSLLGLTLDRSVQEAGATFCAAVVSLRGMQELNRVWAAPDNLPTPAEIKDPFTWMERVLDR
ncbi:MAG: zinc-dependent metalloprotease [Actinomycetota bacterium]